MPRIARFELPDGRKGKLEIPDNATQSDIEAAINEATGFSSQPPAEPTFLDQLQQASQFATQQLDPLTQASLAIPGAVQGTFEKGGEALAETLAGPGITAEPLLGIPGLPSLPAPAEPGEAALRTSPETAAAIGTGVSLVPDVATAALTAGTGVVGKRALTEVLKRTLTSKGVGAEIGALEKAAGISQQIPTTRGLSQSLKLPVKSNFSNVANNVDELLTQGTQLPKQFLADFRKAAEAALKQPTFAPGTTNRAILLKIKDKATQAFNKAVPGREALAQRFASAKSREKLLETLGSTAKTGAKVAAGGGIAAALLNLFGR